jgi:hypothetical protein
VLERLRFTGPGSVIRLDRSVRDFVMRALRQK